MAHVQGLVTARENEYNIVFLHSSEKAADTGAEGKLLNKTSSLWSFALALLL